MLEKKRHCGAAARHRRIDVLLIEPREVGPFAAIGAPSSNDLAWRPHTVRVQQKPKVPRSLVRIAGLDDHDAVFGHEVHDGALDGRPFDAAVLGVGARLVRALDDVIDVYTPTFPPQLQHLGLVGRATVADRVRIVLVCLAFEDGRDLTMGRDGIVAARHLLYNEHLLVHMGAQEGDYGALAAVGIKLHLGHGGSSSIRSWNRPFNGIKNNSLWKEPLPPRIDSSAGDDWVLGQAMTAKTHYGLQLKWQLGDDL